MVPASTFNLRLIRGKVKPGGPASAAGSRGKPAPEINFLYTRPADGL
jgi:hypothetical protein